MSIYAGSNRCDLYKGDYRPATLYQGEQFLAGATDSEPVPLPTAVKGTYNDTVALTVLGKGKQKTTTGANLFDIDNESLYETGACVRENGGIRSNITDGYYCSIGIQDENFISFLCVPGETITFSVPENPEDKKIVILLYGERADGSSYASASNYGTSVTITVPNDFIGAITKINFRWNALTRTAFTDTETFFTKLQLEKGDIATPYEPYTGGKPSPSPDYPQELVASEGTVNANGVNLFDLSKATIVPKNFGLTVEKTDEDYIHIYGTVVGGSGASKTYFNICVYPTSELSGKGYTITAFDTTDLPKDFMIYGLRTESEKSVAIGCVITEGQTYDFKFRFMVTDGAPTGLTYTRYRPPTSVTLPTLRAIPDNNGGWLAQDTLMPVPHMPGWYDLKRQVAEHVMVGNESLTTDGGIDRDFKKYLFAPPVRMTKGTNQAGFCSHYPKGSWLGNKNEIFRLGQNNATIYFYIKNELPQFKEYLAAQHAAGTPVTLWYPRLKPTTERIYLGDLKTYPRYTTLNINGDYPPEVSAKMKIQEGEK